MPRERFEGPLSRMAFEVSNAFRAERSSADLYDNSQGKLNVSAFTQHTFVSPLLFSFVLKNNLAKKLISGQKNAFVSDKIDYNLHTRSKYAQNRPLLFFFRSAGVESIKLPGNYRTSDRKQKQKKN